MIYEMIRKFSILVNKITYDNAWTIIVMVK